MQRPIRVRLILNTELIAAGVLALIGEHPGRVVIVPKACPPGEVDLVLLDGANSTTIVSDIADLTASRSALRGATMAGLPRAAPVAKIEVTSRSQAVVWAFGHGFVTGQPHVPAQDAPHHQSLEAPVLAGVPHVEARQRHG